MEFSVEGVTVREGVAAKSPAQQPQRVPKAGEEATAVNPNVPGERGKLYREDYECTGLRVLGKRYNSQAAP